MKKLLPSLRSSSGPSKNPGIWHHVKNSRNPHPHAAVDGALFSHPVSQSGWAFQGSWFFQIVLLCPICGLLVSSVPTPGPMHSLLSAGCNERKALPVFAGKRAGERANFMRCYSVKGAAPTTSLILCSHPMRRVLSAPFYKRVK